MSGNRTVRIEAFSRVEGEGGLNLKVRDGRLEQVELAIYEPPRLFEALLQGRKIEEVPDITARICGICPVAYQMSSVHALEAALGITVEPEIRRLRRLLYCGEWIESHTLHIHLLQVPDFLGLESGLDLVKDYRREFERGLRLKKHGNQLLEILGGRAIHPVNVAVGGFYRLPRREELMALVSDFQWGLDAAVEMVRWIAGFEFPQFEPDYDFVSLVHPDEYPMNAGLIASSRAPAIPASEFEDHFHEYQVPHSTALHATHRRTGRPYLVGPLARLNHNRHRLLPIARQLADDLQLESPCKNPFKAMLARGLEIVQAYEEALRIIDDYHPCGSPRTSFVPCEGQGHSATEAPRGLLYHRYRIGADGLVREAKIIPPTSQNQWQIETDLTDYLGPMVAADDDTRLARDAENLIRSYDPCISCSTHFLKLSVDRG